jgi:isopropylmalate/homocitrate/citramalate synthase
MNENGAPDRVFIFDTTLRDGEQSPGFHLDANSKLRIARQLEKLGVDVIEAGFPISSPGDFEACRRIAREIRGATVTALARAVREDIDAVWGAIKEAETPQIHIVLSVSDVHIDRKLGMTRAQVLKRGAEMVAYARSLCDRVQYSPEDAGRADPDYLVETVETMIAAGANVINIPDTTGYCLPWEFGEIVRRAITEARGSEKALFSVHCHNDLGLAVANTLAALAAGARRVECTINGIGVLKDRLNYEIMKPEDVGLSDSRIVLTARSGRHAFHHRLSRLGITLADGQVDAAWQRFLQVADTKKEVTDEDLRKIAVATAEPNGNGHETNGHPPVTDQLLDHNHVADTLRHLIFG